MKQYLFLATALLGLAACNKTENLSGYDGQVELRFTSEMMYRLDPPTDWTHSSKMEKRYIYGSTILKTDNKP